MEADSQASWCEDLGALEDRIGHRFADRSLLVTALSHSSYANELPGQPSNERLEFLGDAVIGLAIGEQLYRAHPDWEEGDLTRGLHQLVDRNALAGAGDRLELGRWLRLGRTELQSGGAGKASILADAVEAIVGAIFLDAGLEPVVELSRRLFGAALDEGAPRVGRDPKTRLQEWAMAHLRVFPSYELVSDTGIEGDAARFRVAVRVEGKEWGQGTARSKRSAERAAAEIALERTEKVDG